MTTRPSIFEYLDYRAFLRDMFAYRKQMKRQFSHRFFARESGFASPNFLKLVMDGQRNLTVESIGKIAKGFRLNKGEREFLENLVFMNQAATHDQRNHYYQKMMRLKGFTDIQPLEKASYEYFSNWYCPVIREVVLFGDRFHTPDTIAALLDPPITPKEAEKSLDLLMDLGLIRRDAHGRWEQKDRAVTTGPEVRSLVVANFHREMLRLAEESIERHPSEHRDITSVTLSVNRDKMAEIKEKTAAFRKDLLEMACADDDADQVIQVNIQAFPLTK
jgi:uncharacterized protein (TIGR02147 family)